MGNAAAGGTAMSGAIRVLRKAGNLAALPSVVWCETKRTRAGEGLGRPAESGIGGDMEKRLTRSRDDKMLGGVAAGIARYLDVDPTLVRLAWIVAILLPGPNAIIVLLYLVLCFVLPLEPPGAST
jgi:phage shock protein C